MRVGEVIDDVRQRVIENDPVVISLLKLIMQGSNKAKKLSNKLRETTMPIVIGGQEVELPISVVLAATVPLTSINELPFEITQQMVSDKYTADSYPLLDALGCDSIIGDGQHHRYQPRCVMTSDGKKIVLPRVIDYTSKVMVQDLMKIDIMPVPFTEAQVMNTIKCWFANVWKNVDDVRFLDFLGCDALIDSLTNRVPMKREDYDVILQMRPCLEARLCGLKLFRNEWRRRYTDEMRIRVEPLRVIVKEKFDLDIIMEAARSLDLPVFVLSEYLSDCERRDVTYLVSENSAVGFPWNRFLKFVPVDDGYMEMTVHDGAGVEVAARKNQQLPDLSLRSGRIAHVTEITVPMERQEFRGIIQSDHFDNWIHFPNAASVIQNRRLFPTELKHLVGRRINKGKDHWTITWLHDK